MNGCLPREVLSALADGECGPEERRYAHAHLQECLVCRRTTKEFASVRDLVAGLPRLVAPESFVAEVLGEPSRTRRVVSSAMRGRRRYVAASVASVALAISLAGLAVPPEPKSAPVEELLNHHVVVNDATQVGGQVLFAVNR